MLIPRVQRAYMTLQQRFSLTVRQSVLLTLSLIFLLLLSAVIVGITVYAKDAERSAWQERQFEANDNALHNIESFLNHHFLMMENIGFMPENSLRLHSNVILQTLEQNPLLRQILVVNANGEVLAFAPRNEAPWVRSIEIPETLWFIDARGGGKYVAGMELNANSEPQPYFILSTESQSGNVVAARVKIVALQNIISRIQLGRSGKVLIVDGDGRVIAHPDGNNSQIRYLAVAPSVLEKSNLVTYVDANHVGESAHWFGTYQDLNGEEVRGLFQALPGTDWYIVSEINMSETTAVSNQILVIVSTAVWLLAVLVIMTMVRVLDHSLFAPIALLQQGAKYIGAGHLDHRIAISGDDEIGQVAAAFNEMAGHLHQRQEEQLSIAAVLNREVEKRTQELNNAYHRLQKELEENRLAQKALATVESRLQHLLLTSPAIIFSANASQPLVVNYVSRNIEELTGFRPEQYYEEPWFPRTRIHGDDIGLVNEGLSRLAAVGRISYDYRFLISNGEYKWFHDDVVAVYDEYGQMSEIIGSIIDIDERKRVEAEQAVIRDQALEASRLKSEFLATVSHEIRTPLNGVIGMADLLLSTPLNREQADYAKTILDSADSLLMVINDVIILSKAEAGNLVLQADNFPPIEVTLNVASLFVSRIREKNINLALDFAPDLPELVNGYESRVRQVLVNLVGNAVKFTNTGSVTLHVAVVDNSSMSPHAEKESSGQFLRFVVSDTGIGIDEADFDKLFKPFSQVDSSLARKYGGTGLGLVICKRLVELMGGKIGVVSERNKGSDFWFTVPLVPADESIALAGEDAPAKRRTTDGETALVALRRFGSSQEQVTQITRKGQLETWEVDTVNSVDETSPRLLLVEDNPVNQKVAVAQLRRMGYAVHAVSNGREAVEEVASHAYAAILMDCQMPEMDGFTATRLIRQMEADRGRHIPIIAMTANTMNGDRESCLRAGMDDYLSKPIRVDELKRVLNQWVEDNIL